MRLLWPRLMRSNIFTQLTQLFYFRCALTPDTKPPRACSQLNRRDRDGSVRWREQRDCWAERFCLRVKMTEQSTKLKLYVAFVKMSLAIIILMQSTRQKAVPD